MTSVKHKFRGQPPTVRGSAVHVALGVLKISSTPLTIEELGQFNPHAFMPPKKARDIMTKMVKRGWAAPAGDGYVLTALGRSVLAEVGARNPYRGSSD